MSSRWTPEPQGLYRRDALLKNHVSTRRISSGEFLRVAPAWYTPAAAPATARHLACLLMRLHPGWAVSHVTAAALWGLPLPAPAEVEAAICVHHCAPLSATPIPGAFFSTHRERGVQTIVRGGIRYVTPADLVCQLAVTLEHPDLVALIDALVGPQSTLVSVDLAALRADAERCTGRRGAAALRKALRDARDRVESPQETRVRLLLVGLGFPEPDCNWPILDPDTGYAFRLDLAYPRWRIAIEYDGDHHRTDRLQWRADRHKDDVLHRLGWQILRITADDVNRPSLFLARLRAAITRSADGMLVGA